MSCISVINYNINKTIILAVLTDSTIDGPYNGPMGKISIPGWCIVFYHDNDEHSLAETRIGGIQNLYKTHQQAELHILSQIVLLLERLGLEHYHQMEVLMENSHFPSQRALIQTQVVTRWQLF